MFRIVNLICIVCVLGCVCRMGRKRWGRQQVVDPPSKPPTTKKRKTTINQVHVLIPFSRNVLCQIVLGMVAHDAC
ncbi:hypothetical protein HanRHA438_Chr06g0277381 [Helianthus annuus]|nr:hypothetical protein HanRHA438_Chr06g0277381 [Helianthus annuus]